MKTRIYNVLDLIEREGEDVIKDVLSYFSCEREKDGIKENLNPEIERFLKNGAI